MQDFGHLQYQGQLNKYHVKTGVNRYSCICGFQENASLVSLVHSTLLDLPSFYVFVVWCTGWDSHQGVSYEAVSHGEATRMATGWAPESSLPDPVPASAVLKDFLLRLAMELTVIAQHGSCLPDYLLCSPSPCSGHFGLPKRGKHLENRSSHGNL